MSFWAVVQTQPCAERRAAKRLEQQGFRCYLPELFERKRVQLMFPRYVFLWVEAQWRCVLGTFGVSRILMAAQDSPAKLSEAFIAALKARESRDGYIRLPRDRYRSGQRVQITGGVFEGLYGLYVGATQRDREIVLLDVLGRVELASRDLM